VASRSPAPQLRELTGYLLRRAYVKSVGVAQACITDETHVREVAILAILAERGAISQRDLADLTHVNQTLIVKLVDALERKEWVVRDRNPVDRRSYALRLTDHGKAALVELSADLDGGEAELTRSFSRAEVAELQDLLVALLGDDSALGLTSLSHRTGYLIAHAHRSLRDWAAEALAPLGLDPRDFGALSMVSADEPCSQNQLAARLGISPPAMQPFVEDLASRGLVSRIRRTDDRRVYDVTMTAEGRALLSDARRAATAVQGRIAERLGPDGDARLRALLIRLIAEPAS
jgi:DNA-binding MarR family transcriptional regulator